MSVDSKNGFNLSSSSGTSDLDKKDGSDSSLKSYFDEYLHLRHKSIVTEIFQFLQKYLNYHAYDQFEKTEENNDKDKNISNDRRSQVIFS